MKLSQTNTVATVAHGDGSYKQIHNSCSTGEGNLPEKLIIFCKDSNDYEIE